MRHITPKEQIEHNVQICEHGEFCLYCCWEWQGAMHSRSGYGYFRSRPKQLFAHRVAWELRNKTKIPKGSQCCHYCNNRKCCNPFHLYIGTAKNNMADCIKAGNHYRSKLQGSKHGRSILTENDIITIFNLRGSGMLHNEIAQHFPVSRSAITRILNKTLWKHV